MKGGVQIFDMTKSIQSSIWPYYLVNTCTWVILITSSDRIRFGCEEVWGFMSTLNVHTHQPYHILSDVITLCHHFYGSYHVQGNQYRLGGPNHYCMRVIMIWSHHLPTLSPPMNNIWDMRQERAEISWSDIGGIKGSTTNYKYLDDKK